MLVGSLGLAFLAGVLTCLSPCVLPLLPVVMGAALAEHRYGASALAGGLVVSFVAVGLFIALVGFDIGLDTGFFRLIGGLMLVAASFLLLVPRLQLGLAQVVGPAAGWLARVTNFSPTGLTGQFALGVLLGVVWSPCVGPTLGSASLLAARGESLGQVTAVMLVFGMGAAGPLLLVGRASRHALLKWRGALMAGGARGRLFLGGLILITGLLIVSGLDRVIETFLVEASPQWLTNVTTRY